MMGIDVYRNVCDLLGRNISAADNLYDGNDMKNVLSAINRVIFDLTDKKGEITNLSQKINLTEPQSEALPYGVAMFLCLIEGDNERHAVFTEIYNKKRTRAKSHRSSVVDIMQ